MRGVYARLKLSNLTCTGSRPLHWAAEENHVATVRALLELGADPEATLVDGRTALQLCRTEDGPMQRLLREHRLEAARRRRDLRARAPTPAASSSRDLRSTFEEERQRADRVAAELIAEEEREQELKKKVRFGTLPRVLVVGQGVKDSTAPSARVR